MRYTEDQVVKGCYNECPFFMSGRDGMECTHLYFNDKGVYDNLIITHDNSRDGNIPEQCPLRNDSIELVMRISLDNTII